MYIQFRLVLLAVLDILDVIQLNTILCSDTLGSLYTAIKHLSGG